MQFSILSSKCFIKRLSIYLSIYLFPHGLLLWHLPSHLCHHVCSSIWHIISFVLHSYVSSSQHHLSYQPVALTSDSICVYLHIPKYRSFFIFSDHCWFMFIPLVRYLDVVVLTCLPMYKCCCLIILIIAIIIKKTTVILSLPLSCLLRI